MKSLTDKQNTDVKDGLKQELDPKQSLSGTIYYYCNIYSLSDYKLWYICMEQEESRVTSNDKTPAPEEVISSKHTDKLDTKSQELQIEFIQGKPGSGAQLFSTDEASRSKISIKNVVVQKQAVTEQDQEKEQEQEQELENQQELQNITTDVAIDINLNLNHDRSRNEIRCVSGHIYDISTICNLRRAIAKAFDDPTAQDFNYKLRSYTPLCNDEVMSLAFTILLRYSLVYPDFADYDVNSIALAYCEHDRQQAFSMDLQNDGKIYAKFLLPKSHEYQKGALQVIMGVYGSRSWLPEMRTICPIRNFMMQNLFILEYTDNREFHVDLRYEEIPEHDNKMSEEELSSFIKLSFARIWYDLKSIEKGLGVLKSKIEEALQKLEEIQHPNAEIIYCVFSCRLRRSYLKLSQSLSCYREWNPYDIIRSILVFHSLKQEDIEDLLNILSYQEDTKIYIHVSTFNLVIKVLSLLPCKNLDTQAISFAKAVAIDMQQRIVQDHAALSDSDFELMERKAEIKAEIHLQKLFRLLREFENELFTAEQIEAYFKKFMAIYCRLYEQNRGLNICDIIDRLEDILNYYLCSPEQGLEILQRLTYEAKSYGIPEEAYSVPRILYIEEGERGEVSRILMQTPSILCINQENIYEDTSRNYFPAVLFTGRTVEVEIEDEQKHKLRGTASVTENRALGLRIAHMHLNKAYWRLRHMAMGNGIERCDTFEHYRNLYNTVVIPNVKRVMEENQANKGWRLSSNTDEYFIDAKQKIIMAHYIELTTGDMYNPQEDYAYELERASRMFNYGLHSVYNRDALTILQHLIMESRHELANSSSDVQHIFRNKINPTAITYDIFILFQGICDSILKDSFNQRDYNILIEKRFTGHIPLIQYLNIESKGLFVLLNMLQSEPYKVNLHDIALGRAFDPEATGDKEALEKNKLIISHKINIFKMLTQGIDPGKLIIQSLYLSNEEKFKESLYLSDEEKFKESEEIKETGAHNEIVKILEKIDSKTLKHLCYYFSNIDWSEPCIKLRKPTEVLKFVQALEKISKDAMYYSITECIEKFIPGLKTIKSSKKEFKNTCTLAKLILEPKGQSSNIGTTEWYEEQYCNIRNRKERSKLIAKSISRIEQFKNNLKNRLAFTILHKVLNNQSIESILRYDGHVLQEAIESIVDNGVLGYIDSTIGQKLQDTKQSITELFSKKAGRNMDLPYVVESEYVVQLILMRYIDLSLSQDHELYRVYGKLIYDIVKDGIGVCFLDAQAVSQHGSKIVSIIKSFTGQIKTMHSDFSAKEVESIIIYIQKILNECAKTDVRNIEHELNLTKTIMSISRYRFFDIDTYQVMHTVAAFCADHAKDMAFGADLMNCNISKCIQSIYNNQNTITLFVKQHLKNPNDKKERRELVRRYITKELETAFALTKKYVDFRTYTMFYTIKYQGWVHIQFLREKGSILDAEERLEAFLTNQDKEAEEFLKLIEGSNIEKLCKCSDDFNPEELMISIIEPKTEQDIAIKKNYDTLLAANDGKVALLIKDTIKNLAIGASTIGGIVGTAAVLGSLTNPAFVAVALPLYVLSKANNISRRVKIIGRATGVTEKLENFAEKSGATKLAQKVSETWVFQGMASAMSFLSSTVNAGVKIVQEEVRTVKSVIESGIIDQAKREQKIKESIEKEFAITSLNSKRIKLEKQFSQQILKKMRSNMEDLLSISKSLKSHDILDLYNRQDYVKGQRIIEIMKLIPKSYQKIAFNILSLIDSLDKQDLYIYLLSENNSASLVYLFIIVNHLLENDKGIIGNRYKAIQAHESHDKPNDKVIQQFDLLLTTLSNRNENELKGVSLSLYVLSSIKDCITMCVQADKGQLLEYIKLSITCDITLNKFKAGAENFNFDDFFTKIQEMRYINSEGTKCPLNISEQVSIVQGAKSIITSILIEERPIYKNTSIYKLTQEDCDQLLLHCRKICSNNMINPLRRKKYALIALAIFMRNLFIFSKDREIFLREAQLLAILYFIDHPFDRPTMEIKTGEGKSFTSAISASMMWIFGKTPFILTSNRDLALELCDEFQGFFGICGIKYSTSIILAYSKYKDISIDGINWAEASDLAMCKMSLEAEGKTLPSNSAAVIDEVDAMFTTVVDYVRAIKDNKDQKLFKRLIYDIIRFSETKEFDQNAIQDRSVHLKNFKNYVLFQNDDNTYVKYIKELTDSRLENMFVALIKSTNYKEKKEYITETYYEEVLSNFANDEGDVLYEKQYKVASPILSNTHMSNPQVEIAGTVQQFIHARNNLEIQGDEEQKKSSRKKSSKYKIDNESTIVQRDTYLGLLNFFYKKSNMTFGLSGTLGRNKELEGFERLHNITAVLHPRQLPNKVVEKSMMIYETEEEFKEHFSIDLKNAFDHNKRMIPYIGCATAEDAVNIHNTLKGSGQFPEMQFQTYLGATSENAKDIINKAGDPNFITCVSCIGGRGVDPKPGKRKIDGEEVECILSVFLHNPFLLKNRDLWQLIGRTARNGKDGEYTIVIVMDALKEQLVQCKLESWEEWLQKHHNITKDAIEAIIIAISNIFEQKELLERDKQAPLAEIQSYLSKKFAKEFNTIKSLLLDQVGINNELITSNQYNQLMNKISEGLQNWYDNEIEKEEDGRKCYYKENGDFDSKKIRKPLYDKAKEIWLEINQELFANTKNWPKITDIVCSLDHIKDLIHLNPDSFAKAKVMNLSNLSSFANSLKMIFGTSILGEYYNKLDNKETHNAFATYHDIDRQKNHKSDIAEKPDIFDTMSNIRNIKNAFAIFLHTFIQYGIKKQTEHINNNIKDIFPSILKHLAHIQNTIVIEDLNLEEIIKQEEAKGLSAEKIVEQAFGKPQDFTDQIKHQAMSAVTKKIQEVCKSLLNAEIFKEGKYAICSFIFSINSLVTQLQQVYNCGDISKSIARLSSIEMVYRDIDIKADKKKSAEEYKGNYDLKNEEAPYAIQLIISQNAISIVGQILQKIISAIETILAISATISEILGIVTDIGTAGATHVASTMMSPISNFLWGKVTHLVIQAIGKVVQNIVPASAKPIVEGIISLLNNSNQIQAFGMKLFDISKTLLDPTSESRISVTQIIEMIDALFTDQNFNNLNILLNQCLQNKAKIINDHIALCKIIITELQTELEKYSSNNFTELRHIGIGIMLQILNNVTQKKEVLKIFKRHYSFLNLHKILPQLFRISQLNPSSFRGVKFPDFILLIRFFSHPLTSKLIESVTDNQWEIQHLLLLIDVTIQSLLEQSDPIKSDQEINEEIEKNILMMVEENKIPAQPTVEMIQSVQEICKYLISPNRYADEIQGKIINIKSEAEGIDIKSHRSKLKKARCKKTKRYDLADPILLDISKIQPYDFSDLESNNKAKAVDDLSNDIIDSLIKKLRIIYNDTANIDLVKQKYLLSIIKYIESSKNEEQEKNTIDICCDVLRISQDANNSSEIDRAYNKFISLFKANIENSYEDIKHAIYETLDSFIDKSVRADKFQQDCIVIEPVDKVLANIAIHELEKLPKDSTYNSLVSQLINLFDAIKTASISEDAKQAAIMIRLLTQQNKVLEGNQHYDRVVKISNRMVGKEFISYVISVKENRILEEYSKSAILNFQVQSLNSYSNYRVRVHTSNVLDTIHTNIADIMPLHQKMSMNIRIFILLSTVSFVSYLCAYAVVITAIIGSILLFGAQTVKHEKEERLAEAWQNLRIGIVIGMIGLSISNLSSLVLEKLGEGCIEIHHFIMETCPEFGIWLSDTYGTIRAFCLQISTEIDLLLEDMPVELAKFLGSTIFNTVFLKFALGFALGFAVCYHRYSPLMLPQDTKVQIETLDLQPNFGAPSNLLP